MSNFAQNNNIINRIACLMGIDKKKRKDFIYAYRIYYPVIFNRIYKSTGNREDTEDICQEVFIEFFNNFEKINEKRNWLMTVARNQTALFYRKKKIKQDISTETMDLENNPSLSFINGTRELRILLTEEINNMNNYENETDRTLFELIAILKYSYKEAAAQLKLSRRQIIYKYNKIVKRMLENLKAKGIQDVKDFA